MHELLLIDVALWGALIIMAALIIIRRRRGRHPRTPARSLGRDIAEQAGQYVSPRTTATVSRHDEGPREPRRPAPRPAQAAPTPPPQAAEAKAGPRQPATQRAARRARSRTATPSEPIARYYDQADQPIADYLAAMGWAQEPLTPPGRATDADADSAAQPPDGGPAP